MIIRNGNRFTRTLMVVAIELALYGSASAQEAAAPVAAPLADPAVPAAATVTVSGTRASLAKSRERKRDAAIVMDTITAEDLGRFPDDNVADSLSHISGITVSRTHGGEGQYVNVRGLGPAYSIVTLNNRTLATDGDGREFAFDVLPSETISGADVMKSADATQIEGSIGGAINLRSARPLDTPGFRSNWRVESDYNDLSRNHGGKISGVVKNTYDDNRLGVQLGLVLGKSKTRSDTLNEFAYTTLHASLDKNGKQIDSPDGRDLLAPCCFSVGTLDQEKKRGALSGAIEWKPSTNIRMAFDVLATKLDAPSTGYNQSYFVDHAEGRYSDVAIKDNLVTGMTVKHLTPEIINRTDNRVVNSGQIGWNGEWKVNEALKLTGDVYRSTAKRDSGGKNSWAVAGIPGDHTGYYSIRDGLPHMRVTLADGRDLAAAAPTLGDKDYALHWAQLDGTRIKDTVDGASLAGRLQLDKGVLNSLRFGASNTRRAKTRSTFDNLDYACQYCNYQHTFASLGANVIGSITPRDFMRHGGGSFPGTLGTFDLPAYFNAMKALDGKEIVDALGQPTGTFYNAALMTPAFNPTASYDVTEKTLASYVSAELAGDDWFGSVGLRWVRTRTASESAVRRVLKVDDLTPNDPTSSPTITYSLPTPDIVDGKYSKLLPSLNLGYWAQKNLLARFALARTMARPSLDQLAPLTTDGSVNRIWEVSVQGDAHLKPVEARQGDLSLEWYYNPKSMLTGALYWKNIKNFVTYARDENVDIGVPGQLYTVIHPINGDGARVRGLELGVQHLFSNGFGVNYKYSYTRTRSQVGGVDVGPLEGVARTSSAAALLYEDDRINAQIALDYTGRTVEVRESYGGMAKIADPITWISASLSYSINKSLNVFIEGKNLGDAVYKANLNRRSDALAGFETWGRTVTIGATAKF
ncbi:TonB-dependent receptor [Massilia atriviolacea]|uniref:TonB-dependent receptor n=1 Tax=Massilia atriviolacea TaxID=2495579 RepID=A0A430HTQ8_9BURK|nr:TonB-dependent receptor [Massilia atriviolacea]RSZ60862.1 TonB-dependent receptor [Massilia atriviolacea]